MSVKGSITASPEPAPSTQGAVRVSMWAILAGWTVPAVLTAFETMMYSRTEGRPISLWRAFVAGASGWYVWAAATPLIALLALRFPLSRRARWRPVAIHVGAFLLVDLTASVVWAAAASWVRGAKFIVALGNWFIAALPFTVLVYAAIVGI